MSTKNTKVTTVAKSITNSQTVKHTKGKTVKVKKHVARFFTIFGLLALIITSYGFIKYRLTPANFAASTESKTGEMIFPVSETEVDYKLEERVTEAMNTAHSVAYTYASREVDSLVAEMLQRADENFLDYYFSYVQQKKRSCKSIFNNIAHAIDSKHPDANLAARMELEDLITSRVIIPEISQKRIDNIMERTIKEYTTTLGVELSRIQNQYQIPQLVWDNYIRDVCGLAVSAEGKTVPVAMKTLVLSTGALAGVSTAIAVPALKKVVTKISSKRVAEAATSAAVAKGAGAIGKTAASISSKISIVGWGIAAGVFIWDIVDTCKTNAEGRRQLRSNLESYFAEVKVELLGNTSDSIMGCLTDWENNVKKKMASAE